jgi:hypothetical protein
MNPLPPLPPRAQCHKAYPVAPQYDFGIGSAAVASRPLTHFGLPANLDLVYNHEGRRHLYRGKNAR